VPGIVGIITKKPPREWAELQLERMLGAVWHEPFCETGTWIDEALGIYVGWAARTGSFCERMPVVNERGDVTLVFSGQEYSQPEAIRGLKNRGHAFDERGVSRLVHVYEDDQNFPLGLNGLFHGLVADRTRDIAILFNDRYGMHRLCYHESNDAFYFAAEAKAILAVRPELREANPQSMGEFVACSCILGDRTLFKNIHVLPAASAWVFRNGSIEKKNSYFQPSDWEELGPMDSDSHFHELETILSKTLPLYFAGDERLGMALTGGFDTRLILAWHNAPPGSLPCYTFGSMFRESHDVRVASEIAKSCKQPYEVITVGEEFLSQFPKFAERTIHVTEGQIDLNRTSDLYVSEKARQIAPAKIVGTYGSEIVRHAVMFKPVVPPPGLFATELLEEVDRARDTYNELRGEHPVTFAAFRQSPWYHHGVLALEGTQLTVRSPYLDNDFVRAIYRSPEGTGLGPDVRPRLIREGNRALSEIPTDRGFGGPPARFVGPFDRRLREFSFKAEYAYDYGMPQWVARIDHTLSSLHLERLFLGRHKLCHYRVWYRDELAEYVREMLLDQRTLSRPYIERKRVEQIVDGHTKQGLNYTSAIHKLLSLELLHRLHLDA